MAPNKRIEYRDTIADVLRFVTDEQLLDETLWKRFVLQFRSNVDDADKGWRCEYFGKMMRAGVFVYSCTLEEKLYETLLAAIKDMMTVADEDGRISTYSRECEFQGWDLWGRKYVLLGMIYFTEICRDEAMKREIIECAKRQADYIIARVGDGEGKTPITETSGLYGGVNSASILEPMVKLFRKTGEERYLDFASHIVKAGACKDGNIFELAYVDHLYPYQYPVTKAYEMISCFEGLLEYYRVTGIEKWRVAVENFGKRLLESDISVIGCAGTTHEFLDHAGARQTSSRYTGVKQETCVTVTWMKFCFRLLVLTGDSVYADCFEQSLYNAYLGALNTEHNNNFSNLNPKLFKNPAVPQILPFDSYTDLLHSVRGRSAGGVRQMADGTYYGCCACIGAAGIGLVSHIGLMKSKNGVVLNLYGDAVIKTETPAGNPLTLTLSGGYPKNGEVTVRVDPDTKETFDLSLRIPSWSCRTHIFVNGRSHAVTDGYTVLREEWKKGDMVTIRFDMRAELLTPRWWGRDVLRGKMNFKTGRFTVQEERQDPDSMHYGAIRRGPLMFARDARLRHNHCDPLNVAHDEAGFVNVRLSGTEKVGFPALCVIKVPLADGTTALMVDFADAGKTWNEESAYEVWFPTKI